AYDPVLADMIARYKRMMGFEVFYLTGTDEHGQKIETLAAKEGVSPQAYADAQTAEIRRIWDVLNIRYDGFIRTTDDHHVAAIQAIAQKMYDKGDIYKSAYEGKYCVPCESFFTASQLVDGHCPDCGREVADAEEEAYFFRLSKYQQPLEDYFSQTPGFFVPESRRAEMINNFFKPGLTDLCISRSAFKWGVPLPFDPAHVSYVWLDALSNYITGLGYHPDHPSELFETFWPADLHVIGKDIVRFHTIYWPAFLLSLELPLPKTVLGHPWVLFGEEKMSKTTGNILYADRLAERYGADAVRHYLLSQIPFAQDGSITMTGFLTVYNADLANTIGNLVNRSVAMAGKYFKGRVVKPKECGMRNAECGMEGANFDSEIVAMAAGTVKTYRQAMDAYRNAEAMGAIIEFARRCNKYIDETAPWLLAKDQSDLPRLNAVLYHLLESIRFLGILLSPALPEAAGKIFAQLNTEWTGFNTLEFGVIDRYQVGEATPLFARVDIDKELEVRSEELGAGEGADESAAPVIEPFAEQIDIGQFMAVDLRVALVTAAEPVKKAKKLLKLTLDDGSGAPRTVASGIAQFYAPDDLVGRKVILAANLKPAVICGVESQGMILASDAGEDVKVIFADDGVVGGRVR
ncbi:MAG: methionine--tRNA ligase, partial [Oscillospiraceae bacterium]|nr:methionine--tRNA ligase [Oscillospiraceae bacterium]